MVWVQLSLLDSDDQEYSYILLEHQSVDQLGSKILVNKAQSDSH